MTSAPSMARRTKAWLVVAGTALAALAWIAPDGSLTVVELEAKSLVAIDSDRDGLPDRQEQVLMTDPFDPDTDRDGFGDAEELALQTDPLASDSAPPKLTPSLGMTARGEAGKLLVFMAVHLPKGDIEGKSLRFGYLRAGQIHDLAYQDLLDISNTSIVFGLNGGTIVTYDVEVQPGLLTPRHPLTFFAALGKAGSPRYTAAAKVDLMVKHGVEILRHGVDPPDVPGASSPSNGTTIHLPIPPEGDGGIPTNWDAGLVCMQTTQVVGVVGAVVVHEVVAASCEDSWDTYCSNDCPATVGSTYQTIDTGVLIGG